MQNRKDEYRRWGWFIMAATIVALLLAYTIHATMPLLIVLGVLGFGGGVTVLTLAERQGK